MLKYLRKFKLHIRFFFQNVKYRIRNYKLWGGDYNKTIVLIFSPELTHPGLTDRLKAIVSIYYIASTQGFNFKIIHSKPFEWSKYLSPNECDWLVKESEICKSFFHTKMLSYYPNKKPRLKENFEYHIVSYEGNIHDDLRIGDIGENYSRLFSQLFKPSPYLNSYLTSIPYYGTEYVAIHFRFVNSFEVNEPNYPTRPVSNKEQALLENICFAFIDSIQAEYPSSTILIFCDSNHFLSVSQQKGYKHVEGKLGHISYANNENVILKTFTDMFMIAGAKAVYAGVNDVLYASAFPVCASHISNVHFERRRLPNVLSDNSEIYR